MRRVHLEDGAGLDVRLWAPANKSLQQTAAAQHHRAPPSGNPGGDDGTRAGGRRPQLSSESLAGQKHALPGTIQRERCRRHGQRAAGIRRLGSDNLRRARGVVSRRVRSRGMAGPRAFDCREPELKVGLSTGTAPANAQGLRTDRLDRQSPAKGKREWSRASASRATNGSKAGSMSTRVTARSRRAARRRQRRRKAKLVVSGLRVPRGELVEPSRTAAMRSGLSSATRAPRQLSTSPGTEARARPVPDGDVLEEQGPP